jgi:predicted transcriptional regulator
MVRFTPAELEVMEILWQHGSLNPPQIEELFPRPIKNAALRSILRVLVEKGHLIREKRGRAYFYRPKASTKFTLKRITDRLAEVFCGGSPVDLAAQLLQSEKLSEEDVRFLRAILKEKGKDS